jgi:DNA primase
VDLNDPRAKNEVVEKVAPHLRILPDRITQDHYVDQLAVRLRIPDRRALVEGIRRGSASTGPAGTGMRPALDRTEQDVEDHLLALLLKYEVVTEDVRAIVRPDDFLDACNRAIFDALRRQYAEDVPTGSIEALDPALEEHVQTLLASLSDRASALPIKVKTEAKQTLDKLRKDRYDRLVRELLMDINQAQRDGDEELVDSLLMRYGQLTSEHRQYAPRKSSYFRDTRDPRPAVSKFKPTT